MVNQLKNHSERTKEEKSGFTLSSVEIIAFSARKSNVWIISAATKGKWGNLKER